MYVSSMYATFRNTEIDISRGNFIIGSSNKDIMLITASLGKKDYKNSYKLAKSATVKHPNNPDAWNYLGFSSRKLGKYDESEVRL